MSSNPSFNVGGIMMPRPFKIRRLGHISFDIDNVAESLDFFVRDLGLSHSDSLDITQIPPLAEIAATLDDPRGIFLSVASDHHTIVLAPRKVAVSRRGPGAPSDITNGQLSFQVNSIEEVVQAKAFLESQGITVPRIGRDLPGSNWHTYFVGPDGLTVELYYGMEQMGWARLSKPKSMYDGAVSGSPELPIQAEYQEVLKALEEKKDLSEGTLGMPALEATEVVDGVKLPRPFRASRLGPAYFFVDDVEVSVDFYTRLLGLKITEKVDFNGHNCVYLRAGTEHHSLAFMPKALREELGVTLESTNYATGLQVGNYDQLRRAGLFLASRGWTLTENLPHELHPGIDRTIHVEDPCGNRIMLYYYMEQIGWNGQPRPAELRAAPELRPVNEWPETLPAQDDVYEDFPLLGPLG